jgi:quinol monooxygenase YgiN
MEKMFAVAIFPKIAPENLEQFKKVAEEMLVNVNEQDSILRYDMFFTQDNRSCVVLEEYISPEGVFEHVKRNSKYLEQLTSLGGKIEGSIFPMSNSGEALDEIKKNWDARLHSYFSGKVAR